MSELIFIGTSDAFGAGGRRQSGIVLRGDNGVGAPAPPGAILLDCSPTTGTGLASLGIARTSIDAIAVSHFHADHFGGIPQFLLASNFEDRRERPLDVVGPPGVEKRVFRVAAALGHDMSRGLHFPLRFREWPTGGGPVDVGAAEISTFAAQHQADTRPHSFVISWEGKQVVYSGDTGWYDALPERVGAPDLFVCECTFFDREFEFHLTYQTLLANRERFRAKRMILTHLSEEMTHRRGHLEFECADDGMTIAF